MSTTIGIDCGLTGAVALIGEHSWVVRVTPTLPKGKTGHQYNDAGMAAMLAACQHALPQVGLVVLEKQQAMPGQGVSSMFSVGLGFGLWRGIIAALGLPMLIVHPRTWQKVMLRDIPGDDTKARSIIAASRLFPGVDLKRTPRCKGPDHNFADALLLAQYGQLWLSNGGRP